MASTETFLEMMAVERGAARHTLDAYRRDLADYEGFLAARGQTARDADAAAVRAWLGRAVGRPAWRAPRWRGGCRRSASSTAFCSWRARAADDPTQAIEGPRLRRPLPKAPGARRDRGADRGRARGAGRAGAAAGGLPRAALRDRPAGLPSWSRCRSPRSRRSAASWSCSARAARSAWCRSAAPAAAALAAYLAVREQFLGRRSKGRAYLFPSRSRRGPSDPPAPDPAAEGARACGRDRSRAPLAARAAARLREPSAGRRRRSARAPADARPCRYCHHPDLHPCTGRAPRRGGAGAPSARAPAAKPRGSGQLELHHRPASHAPACTAPSSRCRAARRSCSRRPPARPPTSCSSTSRTRSRRTTRSRRAAT